jgi:glutamate racemase
MSSSAPIGIFDSGVGGLSVAREIRARLPREDLVYLADTANCPYGGRPLHEIRELAFASCRILLDRGAKLLVVACNTATGAALEVLREALPVPVVGLEPAVKPAAAGSATGTIGVMATAATLRTERFERLMREHARSVRVVSQACPGLVELVEAGELDGERVAEALRDIVQPLKAANVDAVVLGCTHYPFLRKAVERALGPDVRVIDSGQAVARQVERVLREIDAVNPESRGEVHLLTTGDAREVVEIARRLWEGPFDSYAHVDSKGLARSGRSSR